MKQLPDLGSTSDLQQLADVLDEALRLLEGQGPSSEQHDVAEAIPPSLFEQCIELCRQGGREIEPIRTIHHLSCTGGTLITKCLAAMPNVMVLNEADPLSTMKFKPENPDFTPTDMLALVRQGNHKVSEELLIQLFVQNLELLQSELALAGKRLLLRDHSHSHFLTGPEVGQRVSVLGMVAERFPTCSIVTVRNPLDSFLSLKAMTKAGGGIYFTPYTFDEYCRRYLLFLDAHEGLPIFKYETFVYEPAKTMEQMCADLRLSYSANFSETFDVFKFSGDSGRSGMTIEPRPRRSYDEATLDDARASGFYRLLVNRLGYEAVS